MTGRLLPEMWRLHQVAKELGKETRELVDASARGEFPRIKKIGHLWFVEADLVHKWLATGDAQVVLGATQDALALADAALGCPGRRGRRRRARGSSERFASTTSGASRPSAHRGRRG